MLHPKTDVMISGLKKQNTPCIHVPKTREVLDDCTFFFFFFLNCVFFPCFAASLTVPAPLPTHFSPPCTQAWSFPKPSLPTVQSTAAQHLYPGRSHNRDSLLFWAEGTVEQQWERTHWNILWQWRLFSVTNNTP